MKFSKVLYKAVPDYGPVLLYQTLRYSLITEPVFIKAFAKHTANITDFYDHSCTMRW
jgi:hypothetical protein